MQAETTSLIPQRQHWDGPATRAHWRRTLIGIVATALLGLLPVLLNAPNEWKAFGLGLVFPGGGFWFTGDVVLAVASLLLFVLSLGLLWALGPVLVPPLVVIGMAAWAAQRTQQGVWNSAQWLVPLALAATLGALWLRQRLQFQQAQRRGAVFNQQLQQVHFAVSIQPAMPAVTESSPEDLASLRYALDLALQPIDRWDGFLKIDQFRESALRYQLNFLQYACAMSQYTRTPAFTGYLAEAQRNAIEKMLQPVVWHYWRWENLWGNLRWNPDPVRRDNVMLSGYWALMVGLYQSLNQDSRYNRPGALSFVNGASERHAYDFPSLARTLHGNLAGSPFCEFPCEPSWTYPFCNSYAMNTLLMHDHLCGGQLGAETVGRYNRSFEQDFMFADGRAIGIKNTRFGFNLPATATMSDAVLVFWMNPFAPVIAQRLWWVMRQLTVANNGAGVSVTRNDFDALDPGNYKLGVDFYSRTAVVIAAREMGDDEIANSIQRELDARFAPETVNGVRRYAKPSVYSNMSHVLARFTRKNALREMVAFAPPDAWKTGPVLADCAYPQVLVAKAVSDGTALELVLRPGAKGGRTDLRIERLRPGMRYRVSGGAVNEVTVDQQGRALIAIDLEGRLEVKVMPLT